MASDHPVFTRAYEVIAALGERAGLGDLRSRVLAEARGRVLIVGLGPGHDLDHLPDAVTSVVALEPSASMREAARTRVHAATTRGLDIEVLGAPAESIPLPDASVDAVLVAYVLCSVEDPRAALAEIRRVLSPEGALLVATPAWRYGHRNDPVYHLDEYREDELARQLRACGFEVASTARIKGAYDDIVMLARRRAG